MAPKSWRCGETMRLAHAIADRLAAIADVERMKGAKAARQGR
jgi:hypothetical protein